MLCRYLPLRLYESLSGALGVEMLLDESIEVRRQVE